MLTCFHSFHLPVDTLIYKTTTHRLGQKPSREQDSEVPPVSLKSFASNRTSNLGSYQRYLPSLSWLCLVCMCVWKRSGKRASMSACTFEQLNVWICTCIHVCLSLTGTGFLYDFHSSFAAQGETWLTNATVVYVCVSESEWVWLSAVILSVSWHCGWMWRKWKWQIDTDRYRQVDSQEHHITINGQTPFSCSEVQILYIQSQTLKYNSQEDSA